MMALYRAGAQRRYTDIALSVRHRRGVAREPRLRLRLLRRDLDGRLDLLAVNGHIDETVRNIAANIGYAQPPHLFLNQGGGRFHDVAREAGPEFALPKVARGLACGDFDHDGDVDLLVTTNQGPACSIATTWPTGIVRYACVSRGTNRIATPSAPWCGSQPDGTQMRMVKSGSSYLSQSETGGDVRPRSPRLRHSGGRGVAERPHPGIPRCPAWKALLAGRRDAAGRELSLLTL